MSISGGARLLLMVPHELQCDIFLGGEYTDTLCCSSHQKDVRLSDCATLQAMALLRSLHCLHPMLALPFICTLKVQILISTRCVLILAHGGLPPASTHLMQ